MQLQQVVEMPLCFQFNFFEKYSWQNNLTEDSFLN